MEMERNEEKADWYWWKGTCCFLWCLRRNQLCFFLFFSFFLARSCALLLSHLAPRRVLYAHIDGRVCVNGRVECIHTEATPIVICHWLRQGHPQRWPTLSLSLLSISIFPFALILSLSLSFPSSPSFLFLFASTYRT